MAKKYLYALLICLSIVGFIVPKVAKSSATACVYNLEAYRGLEMTQLSQELNNTGLIVRIHGAAASSQMFVMSVREPDNFFNHREFSLLAENLETIDTLKKINRHDLVCVGGNIITNSSPQVHIKVSSIQVLEPWQQPKGFAPYKRQHNLLQELKEQNSFIGKVHAIGEEGKILVAGYKDLVIPLFVSATEYTPKPATNLRRDSRQGKSFGIG
ncbi:hypothetical protein I4641_11615 [Waterburya agarophytonicola K14]|uniref:Uncharacterized protein n=1 Tax=Waterburya agarophytonicola KI4 TaxID=2874699 RepID=A0A964FG41_9CYAN|nr:hypothetical protein [Waterburya agarophytonicola]MCC0177626.1 hypothetical protein [Waterburya agarophytonicola KI4]